MKSELAKVGIEATVLSNCLYQVKCFNPFCQSGKRKKKIYPLMIYVKSPLHATYICANCNVQGNFYLPHPQPKVKK